MRKELGIRLHWEEWEWRKVLSQDQMELGDRSLGDNGIEIYDNGSEKFLNFLKFYFLKLKIF